MESLKRKELRNKQKSLEREKTINTDITSTSMKGSILFIMNLPVKDSAQLILPIYIYTDIYVLLRKLKGNVTI